MTDRDREKVLQAVLRTLPVNLITWKRTRQQVAAEIVDAVDAVLSADPVRLAAERLVAQADHPAYRMSGNVPIVDLGGLRAALDVPHDR